MLIARSAEKESMVEVGVSWWKEWRWANGWIEMIYLYRQPDESVTSPNGWQRWQDGATLRDAIREVIGDTSFFEAESLCREHADEVALLKAERQTAEIVRRAKERLDAALEALEEFKRHEQRLFSKRHGTKEGEAYDKARQRTLKRLQPRLEGLEAGVRAARAHYEEMSK